MLTKLTSEKFVIAAFAGRLVGCFLNTQKLAVASFQFVGRGAL